MNTYPNETILQQITSSGKAYAIVEVGQVADENEEGLIERHPKYQV